MISRIRNSIIAISLLVMSSNLLAETPPADRYPESLLYSKPIQITEHAWSAIGATEYFTYENSGHNNNLSFVIGDKGVLVVNGSAAYLLASALHDEIKKITDKPVLYLVDENGQSHASLGNSYWKEQGAVVIAHREAMDEINHKGIGALETMRSIIKERAEGTKLAVVDQLFDDKLVLDLGNLSVEIIRFGPAHSPGDISVYVPQDNLLIAGDMAFHQRLLPIFPETNTAAWLDTWITSFAPFAEGKVIIPGHGDTTDFATVDRWTRGYLEFLRGKVAELLEEGGTLEDAYQIDQSPYAHLHTFDELSAKNAGRVFEAMEFE